MQSRERNMRTATIAATAPVRKRNKLLKRLLHCFAKKLTTGDSIDSKVPRSNSEEDMTSVMSTSEDEDQWLLQRNHSVSEDGMDVEQSLKDDDDDDAVLIFDAVNPTTTSRMISNNDCSAKISATLLCPNSNDNDKSSLTVHNGLRIVSSSRKHGKDVPTKLLETEQEGINNNNNMGKELQVQEEEESPVLIPLDVWREVCRYVNDPTTLCRLACVSKDLHQRVVQEVEPIIWKGLYQHRWIRSSSSSLGLAAAAAAAALEEKQHDDDDEDEDEGDEEAPLTLPTLSSSSSSSITRLATTPARDDDDWKIQFQRRFAWEGHVIRTIQQVVLLELEPELCDLDLLQQQLQRQPHGRIASISIEHEEWRRLLQLDPTTTSTTDIPLDVLCAMANGDVSYHPAMARVWNMTRRRTTTTLSSSSQQQQQQLLHPRTVARRRALLRFAAASTTFTFHCQEVITEMANVWERSLYQQIMNPTFTTTPTTQYAYEETAVILSHALRTVPNVYQRTSSLAMLQAQVSQQLDQMAQVVQRHVDYYVEKKQRPPPPHDASLWCEPRELLFTIHYVLSKHYSIRSHVPIRHGSSSSTSSALGGHDDDDVLHACSISRVLLDFYQEPPREHVDHYQNKCHPILVAIIYQAVARRLGVMGDILYCPEHCHTLLRFSTSINNEDDSSNLLFVDLVQDPGRIMTLAQCQDLIRTCQLLTEQDYSERSRQQLFAPSSGHHHHAFDLDNDDDMDEDLRTSFWSQPPMSIPSVVYWLAAPFFTKHTTSDGQPDEYDEEEDQPFDFLLNQLVESSGGGGGRLISFLQDRMVFFSSIMRHCKLIS